MKKAFLLFAVAVLTCGLTAAETFKQAYTEGVALRNKKQPQKALAVFERAEKLAKTDIQKASVHFYQGVILCETGKREQGMKYLEKTLALYKAPAQKISTQFHIGYYLAADKKYDEAVAAMKKAVEFAKGTKISYGERAKAVICQYLVYQKKYKEAIAAAQQLKLADPEFAMIAQVALFDSARALKDKKLTQETVEKMLGIDCKGIGYFSARRCAYIHYTDTKEYAKALDVCSEISARKSLSKTYQCHGNYYAALTYERMGKKADAIAQWKVLEKSSVPYFVKMAKSRIAILEKKK